MNCQEALSLLYDILDKEASEIDVNEVKDHIARCSHCSEIYRLEGAIKRFLDEKLVAQKNDQVPGLENLRLKIVDELDRQDRLPASGGDRRPFDLAAKTLVAAASLVLLLTTAFYVSGLYQHYRDFHGLESSHAKALTDYAGFANSNHTSTARAYLAEHFTYELMDNVCGYRLVGGDVVDIGDAPTCHFVYASDSSVISVFICDCKRRDVPDDAKDHAVQTAGVVFYDHICPGCRLCYHQQGGALVVTASSDTTFDLHQFIPGKPAPQLTVF
ncbi:MAG: zf-HC2 domain-containing protein [bacterium]